MTRKTALSKSYYGEKGKRPAILQGRNREPFKRTEEGQILFGVYRPSLSHKRMIIIILKSCKDVILG